MPRNLTVLLLTIIFISQLGCKSANKTKKSTNIKEFEGVITYHEIEKASDGSINTDDTVQRFYSNGNYVNVHSETSSAFHIVKDYYLESKPLRLFLFNSSDTLFQMKLNFPAEKLEGFKVTNVKEQVLSRKCENIEVNISYPQKDSTTYTDFNFTFSRGYLRVNKEHFKNWSLAFFNKIINESGALSLKYKVVHFGSSHKNILSSKSYEVISVKEMPINPIMFEIDTSKIKWAK